MNKKCFVLHFILCLMAFFFLDYWAIKGEEISINHHPKTSDVTCRGSLYMSSLSGSVSKENGESVAFEIDVVKPRQVFL